MKYLVLASLLGSLMLSSSIHAGTISNANTQQNCAQLGSDSAPLAPNSAWIPAMNSLSRNMDRQITGRDVVAYKVRWGSGAWSGWIVTGVNDLHNLAADTNGYPNGNITAHLVWRHFPTHYHQYIYCD